ncbi:MAG: cell surface polysaccharide biosynthesis protein [Bacteroidia bacterium]|nr:MAG: cell surface polysaccharide biosynthesis protein [Bacteroidia bacterium]
MVDLGSQYQRIQNEIDQSVLEVIRSTAFINGPAVKRFSENLAKFLKVKHVIPCANGTDALQIALMALDLEPGDEVITSDFTFISTAEVIALLNLKPVLVDVLPDTFNIDAQAVRKAITPKTKVIIPVHLYGQTADMDEIMAIAKEHQLYVIEDAAQSIGSQYFSNDGNTYYSGTMGHIGCTSFFPSKNLGAYGDGGAIFTNDDSLAEKLAALANHGMKVRYYHDFIGVNSRLDTIQAAILDVKLKYLNEYNQRRNQAAQYYDQKFSHHPNIQIPYRDPKSTHVFHQYTLKVPSEHRNALQKYLAEKEIPSMLYYPVPFHRQKAYQGYGYKDEDFPVSNYLSEVVLSLPMHSELSEEQLEYITETVLEYFKQNGK